MKPLFASLLVVACGSSVAPPGDAGSDSGPEVDSGIPGCPTAADYVGDPSWPGQLVASNSYLCVYPRMIETALEAYPNKHRVRIADGTYPYPFAATDAPFRLPMCLEPRGTEAATAILEGTATGVQREDISEFGPHHHVSAHQPMEGTSTYVQLELSAPLDAPQIDLTGAVSNYWLAHASLCATSDCFHPEDLMLLPCRLTTNVCDQLTFTGGSISIDQFHWAGDVGAGFAAAMRVTGELDSTSFDVADYDRITSPYGVHAFTRGLLVFFEAPIAGACGLSIERIEEGTTAEVQLVDCSGAPISSRAIVGQNHLWGMGCPASP